MKANSVKFTTLKRLQKEFRRLVTGAEIPCELSPKLPFKADAAWPLARRLGVYHYAYRARFRESLADDFPRLKRHLGKREFANTVEKFLDSYAAPHNALAEVSRDFAKSFRGARRALAWRDWLEIEVALSEDSFVKAPVGVLSWHASVRFFAYGSEVYLAYCVNRNYRELKLRGYEAAFFRRMSQDGTLALSGAANFFARRRLSATRAQKLLHKWAAQGVLRLN